MSTPSFIFGGQTGETQNTLARKRKVAEALMVKGSIAPKNVGEGLSAIGNALLYRSLMKKIDGGEKETSDNAAMDYNALFGGSSPAVTPGKTGGDMPKVDSAGNVAPVDIAGGDVFTPFMDTVKTGVQNPYALAAIAATGNAESKFSPGNVNRTWSDPSESGQPGTAGGIMSWRGPRYEALAATGDLTPAGQAKFFLQENPQLIEALNKAGSVEEAQSLMNKAWQFAGYDKPGGEAQRRLSAANAYLPQFQGQQPTEVASLDPSAGMPLPVETGAILPDPSQPQTAAGAIEQQAPLPAGESLSDEAAAFRQTPEYAAQFPGQQAGQPDPRVAAALANPQGGAQVALPVIPQQDTAQQPQANPQVAQALMAGDQSGVGIGGAVPQEGYFPAQPNQAAQSGPSMQQLMQAAANPNLNDGQRAVVNALLQRKIETDQRASDPTVALDTEYKRAQIDALRAKAAGKGEGADEWGLNPVWGKDKDGNTVLGQASKSGKFKPLDTGDFTPTPGINNIDTGTSIITRDSKTGETLSATPKENFKEAYDTAAGGAEAKTDADTKAEYESITSKMPGLYSVVDRLTDLADKATYTMAGQTVDWGRNQLGMEPRESAVARAEYTATVDNQILPLLRDTFGAQFTNEEGLRLAKTLGDADKSPTEKQALLKAFIQQKERDIQALRGRVGQTGGVTQDTPAAQPSQKRLKFNPATGELE